MLSSSVSSGRLPVRHRTLTETVIFGGEEGFLRGISRVGVGISGAQDADRLFILAERPSLAPAASSAHSTFSRTSPTN